MDRMIDYKGGLSPVVAELFQKFALIAADCGLKSGLVLGVPLIEIYGLIENSRLFCLDSYLV
jgi:tetrahydromethanopterin S-methyltransferase subunit G